MRNHQFAHAVFREINTGDDSQAAETSFLLPAGQQVLALSRREIASLARLPRVLVGEPGASIHTLNLSYNCLTDISPITGDVLPALKGVPALR